LIKLILIFNHTQELEAEKDIDRIKTILSEYLGREATIGIVPRSKETIDIKYDMFLYHHTHM
jgi:hypothetical protein